MKKLYAYYLKVTWDKRVLWTGAGLALLPILLSLLFKAPAESTPPPAKPATQMDTFIPKGFVLVPIDVQNYESLDSIIGHFAVVDLLQMANPQNPQQHLVARNVRLLRAPQNPSHFAVLVAEPDVAAILRFGSLFTVIVKHPDNAGTEFVKDPSTEPVPAKKSQRRIISYEGAAA
jgi:hypothetical protein